MSCQKNELVGCEVVCSEEFSDRKMLQVADFSDRLYYSSLNKPYRGHYWKLFASLTDECLRYLKDLEIAVDEYCAKARTRCSIYNPKMDTVMKQAIKCKKVKASFNVIASNLRQQDLFGHPVFYSEFKGTDGDARKLLEVMNLSSKKQWGYLTFAEVKYYNLLAALCVKFDTHPHYWTESGLPSAEMEQESLTQEQNVIFLNERETVRDTGHKEGQKESTLREHCMFETPWTIKELMAKPLMMNEYSWSVGQEVGKTLATILLPGDYLPNLHLTTIGKFMFFRGNPQVRVMLNSTKFHQGRLLVCWMPRFYRTLYSGKKYTFNQLSALPHIMLDASDSNSGVLDIPFQHPAAYFNTYESVSYDWLGEVIIVIFNDLRSSTIASSTVDFTVWISYKDAELHIPSPFHEPSFPRLNMAPIAEMSVSMTDVVGKTNSSVAHGDGLDHFERLSLYPNEKTEDSVEATNTTADEMDILYLVKTPSRLTYFEWGTDNESGSILRVLPATPTSVTSVYALDGSDYWEATMLSYVSRSFKYWRGGLRFKVQVIASSMQSGRLQISFSPGYNISSFGESNAYNLLILDIQEKHEVEFVIPFVSEKPWLRCDRLASIEQNADSHVPDVSTGHVNFHVLNRLTCPLSIAQTVQINVFVSAADDFQLTHPSDFALWNATGLPNTEAMAEMSVEEKKDPKEMKEEMVTDRQTEMNKALLKGSPVFKKGKHFMPEVTMNLKDVLSRYYKIFENYAELPNRQYALSILNTPLVGQVNGVYGTGDSGVANRTHLAHFGDLYAFWRGSIRYKLVLHGRNHSTGIQVKVIHVPGCYYQPFWSFREITKDGRKVMSALESYGTVIGVTNIQNSWEFEIPFFTTFTQLSCATLVDSTSCTGSFFIIVNVDVTSHIHYELYHSVGSDFRYSFPKTSPLVRTEVNAEKNRDLSNTSQFIFKDSFLTPFVNPVGSEDKDVVACMPVAEMFSTPRNPYSAVVDLVQQHTKVVKTTERVIAKIEKAMFKSTAGVTDIEEGEGSGSGTTGEESGSGEDDDDDDNSSIFSMLAGFLGDLPAKFKLPNITNLVVKVSNIVSGFNSFLMSTTWFTKACAIITLASELLGGLVNKIKKNLISFVMRFLRSGTEQGNQVPVAEADILTFIPALVGVITLALVAIGFKSIPDDKETDKLVGNITTKLRLFNFSASAISNFKSLFKDLKELVQWMMEEILSLCAPQILAQLKLSENMAEVEKWAQSIDRIAASDYVDICNLKSSARKSVFHLAEMGERYNNLLLTGKIGKEALIVRQYVTKIFEIRDKVITSYKALPYRIDPFCVSIAGDTRVGKSACASEVANHLMDTLGYANEKRWLAVSLEDDYFNENYDGHTAVYFDDFSQFNTEGQYLKFFSLKNNNQYPLNMAFKKGVNFTSHFIFMTTNVLYPAPNCLVDHKALWGRRNALIEMRWRDGRKEDGLAGLIERTQNYSHAQFRFRSTTQQHVHESEWLNFQQMQNELARRATQYMQAQEALVTRQLEARGYQVPDMALPANNIDEFMAVASAFIAEPYTPVNFDQTINEEDFPEAEVLTQRVEYVFSRDKAEKNNHLRSVDPDLFDHIFFDNVSETFKLQFQPGTTEETKRYLEEMWNMIVSLDDYQCKLVLCLEVKCVQQKWSMSSVFQPLKDWLKEKWTAFKNTLPWLEVLEQWPFLIGASIVALATTGILVGTTVMACICKSLRHFGYRCGRCGKWPKLKDCSHKEWILSEWRKLYGPDLEYQDGRKTTLEEENALRTLMNENSTSQFLIGTVEQLQSEMGPYSDTTRGGPRMKVIAQVGPYSDVTKGQGAQKIVAENAQRTESLLQNRIIPYIYAVKHGNPVNQFQVNCFAIGDRKVLIPKHFTDVMKDGDVFEIYHNGVWMPVKFLHAKCIVLPRKDLVVYEMPIHFHQHKSLVNHFVEEARLGMLTKTSAVLVRQLKGIVQIVDCKAEAVKEVKYTTQLDGKTSVITVQSAWKYAALTGAGSCGSVLLTTENKSQGQILGIHCCGNGHFGWSQLITKEMIAPFVNKSLGTPIPEATAEFTKLIPEGHFGRIGCAEKGIYQSDKTTIIPTVIQGLITDPETAPSVLSIRDPRLLEKKSMLRAGLEKYGHTIPEFDHEHRKMVNESIRADMDKWVLQRVPRVLSDEEAIFGVEGFEGFDRLPMNTSPGYPYVLTRPKGADGKAYLFDLENKKIQDKSLFKAFTERECLARRGERVVSVWVNCLKDERRPWEKILSGNTRMFEIPPVDFSILQRKYTLDFMVALKDNRRVNHCQLGIDCQSLEWTELHERLVSHSNLVADADFKNFDGLTAPDLQQDYWDDVDYFYQKYGVWTPGDREVRMTLCDEGIHTVCLSNKEFVMVHIGNKSGNPGTVGINSVVNYRYHALAYLALATMFAPSMASMFHFKKSVKIITYGDDVVISVLPEVASWYHPQAIGDWLLNYGIVYTSANKKAKLGFTSIEEVTFLKNRFAKHSSMSNVIVPLMAERTMMELLNWTRIAPDQDVLLEDNCNDCLRFAYFYGEKYFQKLRQKIVDALNSKNLRLDIMTYGDFHWWFMFVIGKVGSRKQAESFFESVASSGNSRLAKFINKLFMGPFYKVLSHLECLRDEKEVERSDDRYAIAIPSGEGKSWLCRTYPHMFVDHDELLLPSASRRLQEKGLNWKHLWEMFDEEFPADDRRILLCHHPNNTKRQMLGCFVLPKPCYIRANAYQRLRLKNAQKMERDERNRLILKLVKEVEPQLANPH